MYLRRNPQAGHRVPALQWAGQGALSLGADVIVSTGTEVDGDMPDAEKWWRGSRFGNGLGQLPVLPSVAQLVAMIAFEKKRPLFAMAKDADAIGRKAEPEIRRAGEHVRRSPREHVTYNDLMTLQTNRWLVEKVGREITESGMRFSGKIPAQMSRTDPAEGPWLRARDYLRTLSTMAADYLAGFPPAEPDPDNAFWQTTAARYQAFLGGIADAATATWQAAKQGAAKAKALAAQGVETAAQVGTAADSLAKTSAELAAHLNALAKTDPLKAAAPFGIVALLGVGAAALLLYAVVRGAKR